MKPQQKVITPPRDLGFGAVVSDQSHYRLLNQDGTFNVHRRGLPWRASLSVFNSLLGLSWPQFIALVALFYIAANGIFAIGYLTLGPTALSGSAGIAFQDQLEQAFFFSVQTFSTVGYGHINPVSTPANLLMTIEAIVGMLSTALATGLVFARFSRPIARIRFTDQAVIGSYGVTRALKFRIANLRKSQIIELQAKVVFSRLEKGTEGRPHRAFYDLPLERRKVTFFPLHWTIVHPIDEKSPLRDLDRQECLAADIEILVLLTGIDDTFSQTVHARSSYKGKEIVWGADFAQVFEDDEEGSGPMSIDMHRLGEIIRQEPLDSAA